MLVNEKNRDLVLSFKWICQAGVWANTDEANEQSVYKLIEFFRPWNGIYTIQGYNFFDLHEKMEIIR